MLIFHIGLNMFASFVDYRRHRNRVVLYAMGGLREKSVWRWMIAIAFPCGGVHPGLTSCATPDLLSNQVALANFMRLSSRKAAQVAAVSAA
jgi:hypothetical protein